jgi:hypothetical protein
MKIFGQEWYVTNAGKGKLGKSEYVYFLIKPTANYTELFNLEREIVAVISPYIKFEPRTLDAFDWVTQKFQTLRIEKVCTVLISNDEGIEEKITDLLKVDTESQIIVPFSYKELLENKDSFFLRNRFKKYFYSRDLFAFEAPLRKDLYFFGRNDLVNKIVNRHESNENSGLFGLRKTGKTSVIYGVERTLKRKNEKYVFIDCQNPSFHQRKWNRSLYYIIEEIKKQNELDIKLNYENNYTEENAAFVFEHEIRRIHKQLNEKPILLIFDEIENITFKISPSKHWAEGLDFVYFWQTLRAVFQKLENVFSYLIVGTNPMCVETPSIQGKDNPIFNQVYFEYIPGFDVPQTREMVRKLGRIMGIKFDEIIYSKLTEDFGGHPFLIRHICSIMNRNCSSDRPVTINKAAYEKGVENFRQEYSTYIDMILQVLLRYYSDEYEMLKYLAMGDYENFTRFSNLSPQYTNHLLGYGIIGRDETDYYFKIESVKEYLLGKHKYEKLNLSNDEMLNEISIRRNRLEPQLRRIIRTQLQAKYGQSKSKEVVLDVMGGCRKERYKDSTYNELFDANKTNIYFEDLRKIMSKHWEDFKYIFEMDKQEFNQKMETINKNRCDAHAKEINLNEMTYFRLCISDIEEKCNNFLD